MLDALLPEFLCLDIAEVAEGNHRLMVIEIGNDMDFGLEVVCFFMTANPDFAGLVAGAAPIARTAVIYFM